MPAFYLQFFRALGVYGFVFFLGAAGVAVWNVWNTNWLPEHLVMVVVFKVLLQMGDFFPSLFISALALAFSFSVRSSDFLKTPDGRIDPVRNINLFFYLALGGAILLLVFQFVAGPLMAQSVERFREEYRMVSHLESQLREAHEREVSRNSSLMEAFAKELADLENRRAELASLRERSQKEARDLGLLVNPQLEKKWNEEIQTLDTALLEKRRHRPLGMDVMDWRENVLIPYAEDDPEALTYQDQLAINQKILLFRPSDERALEAVSLLQKALSGESLKKKFLIPGAGILDGLVSPSSSPFQLLEEAEQDMRLREFYSANAKAFLAYRFYSAPFLRGAAVLDKDFEARVQAVLEQSYREFGRIRETAADVNKIEVARKLETALNDYRVGRYAEAYYALRDLKLWDGENTEVSKFLVLAEQALRKDTLFVEEARELFQMEGSGPMVFLNPLGLTGAKEMVSVGNMVISSRGAWFQDLEILRWDTAGKIILRFKADFGLYSAGEINMNFRHKEDPGITAFPISLVGNLENPRKYRLNVGLSSLELLSRRQYSTTTLSVYDLFNQIQGFKLLGYSTRLLETVVIQRSLESLLLLSMAFFAFWISWFFRSRHLTQAPVGLIFLSIFLPLTVWVLYSLVLWVFSLMVGALIPSLGFYTLLVVLGAGGTGLVILNVILSRMVLVR